MIRCLSILARLRWKHWIFFNLTIWQSLQTTWKSITPHKDNCSYFNWWRDALSKEALVGDIALNTISSVNADICIIGCSGVDVVHGVTTKILNESTINEMMVNKTIKCKILVADHRKSDWHQSSRLLIFQSLIIWSLINFVLKSIRGDQKYGDKTIQVDSF